MRLRWAANRAGSRCTRRGGIPASRGFHRSRGESSRRAPPAPPTSSSPSGEGPGPATAVPPPPIDAPIGMDRRLGWGQAPSEPAGTPNVHAADRGFPTPSPHDAIACSGPAGQQFDAPRSDLPIPQIPKLQPRDLLKSKVSQDGWVWIERGGMSLNISTTNRNLQMGD